MKKVVPSQKALEDQLNDLEVLAARNGLYDAQDWLRTARESIRTILSETRAIEAERAKFFFMRDDDPEHAGAGDEDPYPEDEHFRSYNWCRICDSDWDIGAPEKHNPGCRMSKSGSSG